MEWLLPPRQFCCEQAFQPKKGKWVGANACVHRLIALHCLGYCLARSDKLVKREVIAKIVVIVLGDVHTLGAALDRFFENAGSPMVHQNVIPKLAYLAVALVPEVVCVKSVWERLAVYSHIGEQTTVTEDFEALIADLCCVKWYR